MPDIPSLSPRICQFMKYFFVKIPKHLSATSNLFVVQDLVHLDRFMHFSEKLVGVTLNKFSVRKDILFVMEDNFYRMKNSCDKILSQLKIN